MGRKPSQGIVKQVCKVNLSLRCPAPIPIGSLTPFIRLFLILLPLFIPALSFAADQTRNVFGQESFVRTSGVTTVYNRTFNVPPHASSPFSLHIVNGNPDGTLRIEDAVSSGRVLIDGLEVVSPNDFSKTVAVIDKPLTLAPGNHALEIQLNSAPNSYITLTISGAIPLGDLGQARSDHTATILPDGGILMTGGRNATGPLATAERLDLGTLLFSPLPGVLNSARSGHSGSDLADQQDLLVGGENQTGILFLSEHFDPASGLFTNITDGLRIPRAGQTATVLLGGRVLIAGGQGTGAVDSSEVFDAQNAILFKPSFDPSGGSFILLTHSLSTPRRNHTATLLPDGSVLILGGENDLGPLGSAERFDPATEAFTPLTASMTIPRADHTATLLPDGRILILGGRNASDCLDLAEFFDPVTGAFSPASQNLDNPRADHTATLLPFGEVLIAGGEDCITVLSNTTFYEPLPEDAIPPAVAAVDPANGASDIDLTEVIGIRFSEPVDVTTLNGVNVSLTGSLPVDATIGASENGLLVFIVPKAKLEAGTTYTLSLSPAITDTAGNPLPPFSAIFTTVDAPVITAITPDHGAEGQTVMITGQHFDPSAPTLNVVEFGGVEAFVSASNATLLEVSVPFGAPLGAGTVTVKTRGGTASAPFTVENLGPAIQSFTPASGPVGTPVTITGLNFDPLASNNRLSFNGTAAIITSATTTEIKTTVPLGATTGPITLTTPTGTTIGGTFTVALSEDFSITATPISINVVQGEQTAIQILLSGAGTAPYSGLVTLTVGPLPTGVTSYYSPSIGRIDQAAFLNLFTPATLSPGTYTITVQGQAQIDGQTVLRETAFSLNVLGAGTTTLSGRILSSETGDPLANVLVKHGTTSVQTDAAGNFFFPTIPPGNQLLLVDGTPAGTAAVSYPIDLPVQVQVLSGISNILPYPVYLHEVNTKHFTLLDSTQEVIVTDPDLPGFELRIPQGVQIIGWDGLPNTKISVKAVPIDRLPLPPIPGTDAALTVYMFHFFKAGGGTPTQPIPVKYPNDAGLPPGTQVTLLYYDEEPVADPTSHQWKTFGTGTVSSDARQIVSDPGVGIPKFCCGGSVYVFLRSLFDDKPTPDEKVKVNDPVNLATGFFELQKTDMVLPGKIPIQFTRFYTARRGLITTTPSNNTRPFGLGTSHGFNPRLVPSGGSSDALVLVRGDDGRAPFSRNPDGTFINDTTPSLRGAVVFSGTGGSRILRFRDGKKWIFTGTGFLNRIEDRNGNALDLVRDGNNLLTKIVGPGGREIQLQYDGASRITALIDPIGRRVQYRYNLAGLLSEVIDPAGGITRYAYDAQNRMTTLTDARGILFLTNEYDANDRVIRQTNADGAIYQYRYFGPGGRALIDVPGTIFSPSLPSVCQSGSVITVFIDPGDPNPPNTICTIRVVQASPAAFMVSQAIVIGPEGNPTSYRFNAAGYPIEITDAAGRTSRSERAQGSNLLLSSTDSLGRVTRFQYDAEGEVTTITDPDGNVTTFTYEPSFKRVKTITDALGNSTTFDYDAKGNLLTTTDPSAQITTIAYNATGQPSTVTDPLGNLTLFKYDAVGNLIFTTDPLGNTTARNYDPVSRLLAVTDPRGKATVFAYDTLNRVTEVTDAGNGVTRFTYDPNGNLRAVTDARGQTTAYTYDTMDRLKTRTDPLLRLESYSYDFNGNLKTFTDRKAQVTTFSYDPLNRRALTQYGDGSRTAFHYDQAGRLARVEEPLSATDFAYDSLDRLIEELTPQGIVSYTYDVLGRRTSMAVNGHLPVSYLYDTNSRLTQVAQGTQVVGLGYDVSGRRTTLSYPNGTSTSYAYDAASRLTGIVHKAGITPFESLTYTYDVAGNPTSLDRTNGASVLLPDTVQAAYDAANEQIRFNSTTPNLSYDANGNLLSQTDASGTANYTWDARNRLMGISGPGVMASFVYDALGRRTSKTINGVKTDFQYDGNDIVSEIGGGAVGASYLRSLNIDEPFVRQGASTEYYHLDGLGSSMALSDDSGSVTTTYDYGAFGKTVVNGASTNASQFTGRENDQTGLHYFRSRYYSATLHRFISEDPVRSGANYYAYVGNRPLMARDPFGLFTVVIRGGFGDSPIGSTGSGAGLGSIRDRLRAAGEEVRVLGPDAAGEALNALRANQNDPNGANVVCHSRGCDRILDQLGRNSDVQVENMVTLDCFGVSGSCGTTPNNIGQNLNFWQDGFLGGEKNSRPDGSGRGISNNQTALSHSDIPPNSGIVGATLACILTSACGDDGMGGRK